MELDDLSYNERAVLLSIAYCWYKEDNHTNLQDSNETRLNHLEQKIWMFKIKAKIENGSQVCRCNMFT